MLVKKSDAESSFYYMGRFDIVDISLAQKLDNKGIPKDITKVAMRMQHAVREDLLLYLKSNISEG